MRMMITKKTCHEMEGRDRQGNWVEPNEPRLSIYAAWKRRGGKIIINCFHMNYCYPPSILRSSAITHHKVQRKHNRNTIKADSKVPRRPVSSHHIVTSRVYVANNGASNA